MICPHCGVRVSLFFFNGTKISNKNDTLYSISVDTCPECAGLIAELEIQEDEKDETLVKLIYPNHYSRHVEPEVPHNYKTDFIEACAVLALSPKSSAALSRRLLQQILRDEYNIHQRSLAQEIDEFIKKPDIPTYVKDAVDAIRNVGNFAAHPLKDTQTGQIIDVEPGEAEWLIDVLETLFDVTFVQPKRLEERQKQLNEKLKKAGISPMKKS